MVYVRYIFVAISAVLSLSAAAQLYCFEGTAICNKWKNVKNAEHGTLNNKVVCCPPESGQAIIISSQLANKQQCKCQAGDGDKYTKNGDLKSSASSFKLQRLAYVAVIFVVAVFLL